MESNRNSIVPVLLDDTNYKTWSSCMEDYLLSQDLWDVIEENELETSESTPDSSNKKVKSVWRKKNASALHAIKMSCGPDILQLVVDQKSAKKAWDMLAERSETEYDYSSESTDEETTDDGEYSYSGFYGHSNYDTKYEPFVKATRYRNWRKMEKFIDSHPRALAAMVFPGGRTALHCATYQGLLNIAMSLVDRMRVEDLEIRDRKGYTALAVAADRNNLDLLDLVRAMVAKNPKLASIGDVKTLPVLLAAKNGLGETTSFLYQNTDMKVLDPNTSEASVTLLIRCIDFSYFDVPLQLVKEFPEVLQQNLDGGTFPILSFAKKFSTLRNEVMKKKKKKPNGIAKPTLREAFHSDGRNGAIEFLDLVCTKVSAFDDETLGEVVQDAMIEASRSGNIDFITAMLSANPNLIRASDEKGRTMFWHAVVNRNQEIFNLIFGAGELIQNLLSFDDEDGNNIVHYAAMLPPITTLDRLSTSPALQIQRELQWFKEVQSLVKPDDRKLLNKDGLTPRELFDQSHKILMHSGEKLMKETAQSCTTVAALIVTIMFAAAFTVPGGNNQDTGYPLFKGDAFFSVFIACDAMSLSSSTASILIFLEILTSSYVNEDFVLHLPRKIMMGLLALFTSITTMMLTFCLAIAIMFEGRSQFIIPISLLASSPVVLFLSSIFSLVYQIFTSTFGPSIFKKNIKLLEKRKVEEIPDDRSSELSDEEEGSTILKNPSYSDHIVQLV